MKQTIFKRIFQFQEMILLLSLCVLACLPLALANLVRGASLSLLVPITLLGMLLAAALATAKTRKSSAGIILLFLGPLSLFIRIGQLGDSLFALLNQSLHLIPALYVWLRFKTPIEPAFFVAAIAELHLRLFILVERLSLWVVGVFYKTQIEDPMARTLIWSLGLWLVAIWAGWQMYRNKHLLLGILPSTFLLALVLDYTGKRIEILWFHIALLFFLIGLSSYANIQKHWDTSNIDYADSTRFDTLSLVGVLTITLLVFSFLGSTLSFKNIFEELRQKRTASNTAQTEILGLEPAKEPRTVSASFGGLPRSHLITGGPELSKQLAMTISTGDLPPIPLEAHVTAPHYYWRTLTYQIYTGYGWANPAKPFEEIISDQTLFEPADENIRIVHQRVTLPNQGGQLFWTGTLLRADVPFQAVWNHKADAAPQNNPRLASDLLAALAPVQSYQADSMLLNFSANDLRASNAPYPAWVQKRYLLLPESVPERVLALARDLTASEPTPYDRALAIQNYLREFPYTLEVTAPPAGRDAADYFLFDLKRGYCDYYATTMAVLARAAGLPARLVIGYANGTYDQQHAEYIVTENYAHSWVEIYFTDIGWVEFEPTAAEPAILYAEAAEALIPEPFLPEPQPVSQKAIIFFQGLLANAWMALIFLIGMGLLWVGWDALRITRLEPAQTMQLLFKRLRRLSHPMHKVVSLEQTAHQYAFILTEKISLLETSTRLRLILSTAIAEINQLTELYSRSLFASFSPSASETRNAINLWSRLRWKLLLVYMIALKNKKVTRKHDP